MYVSLINKKNIKYLFFVFLTIVFLSDTRDVFAAGIQIKTDRANYSVGDTIRAKVIVNSDSSINAVSAKISFSKDLILLSSISKTGSIISFWAQEPAFSNITGQVDIEGVILNGYYGNSGDVITLVFKAVKEGKANIALSSASVLANDGTGTDIFSKNLTSLSLNIGPSVKVPEIKKEEIIVDTGIITIDKVADKTMEAVDQIKEKISEVEVTNDLPNYSLLITIIVLLIILIIFLIIMFFVFVMKLKKYFNNKLLRTENIINLNFDYLESDINSEIKQNTQENVRINKDLTKIRNEIIREVKEVEKEL